MVAGLGGCAGCRTRAEMARRLVKRSLLGTYTHNSSTAGQSDGASGRHWFSLRDWQHRKVDRSDPRQVQAARDQNREERWELRRRLRRVFETPRVNSCGQAGARPDGSVALRYTPAGGGADGRDGPVAGYSGLFRCNNVWLCPDCSVRKSAVRAEDIALVLAYFVARGGWAALVTLTGRHWREHGLAQCVEATGKAWSRVTSGGTWSRDVRLSEYAGFVRALEITESPENGWHVHVHAILVFEKRPSRDVLDHLTGGMFARWSAALVRAGLPAPLIEHGRPGSQAGATSPTTDVGAGAAGAECPAGGSSWRASSQSSGPRRPRAGCRSAWPRTSGRGHQWPTVRSATRPWPSVSATSPRRRRRVPAVAARPVRGRGQCARARARGAKSSGPQVCHEPEPVQRGEHELRPTEPRHADHPVQQPRTTHDPLTYSSLPPSTTTHPPAHEHDCPVRIEMAQRRGEELWCAS